MQYVELYFVYGLLFLNIINDCGDFVISLSSWAVPFSVFT